jgi:hypothetical protein
MRSAVVLLRRESMTPKSIWRDASFRRTMHPVEISSTVLSAWTSHHSELVEQGVIAVSLEADGSQSSPGVLHPMQSEHKKILGSLEISFTAPDTVKVILRGDKLHGVPKRATRQIAVLRPWRPIRILMNGRFDAHSDRFYTLSEYHLALCNDPAVERLPSPRFIDLQADLY